jgi:hypothetical protein
MATACRPLLGGRRRQPSADVALVVGGDALEPADGDRLVLDPAAAAGRLARAVAGPPEDPGEDVGFPVDHIGVGVAALRDQADVFRDGRVRRASPLAIDDLMKVAVRRLRAPQIDDRAKDFARCAKDKPARAS